MLLEILEGWVTAIWDVKEFLIQDKFIDENNKSWWSFQIHIYVAHKNKMNLGLIFGVFLSSKRDQGRGSQRKASTNIFLSGDILWLEDK